MALGVEEARQPEAPGLAGVQPGRELRDLPEKVLRPVPWGRAGWAAGGGAGNSAGLSEQTQIHKAQDLFRCGKRVLLLADSVAHTCPGTQKQTKGGAAPCEAAPGLRHGGVVQLVHRALQLRRHHDAALDGQPQVGQIPGRRCH